MGRCLFLLFVSFSLCIIILTLVLVFVDPIWLRNYTLVTIDSCVSNSINLKLSEGVNQRVRIRVREVGRQLKGQEQVQSEIKYELEDEAIGTEWTPINILISRYANTARQGVVLQISHVLEITAIGGTQSIHFVNIPITLA